MRKMILKLSFAICLAALSARAELVHVFQRTVAGTTTTQLSDTVLETGTSYTTQEAPAISGYIFTHWSISTAQPFTNRDRWGRALDAAPYTLYEETTLTANYLPASQDTDSDGVADGHELYWYGGLQHMASSDTDNDGFTFAEELDLGANPLFADEYAPGGIEWADSALLLYNPFGYQPYILRSEPEGELFATTETYVRPGTAVTTPSYDHESTIFAYWDMNGPRQADRWGRALDAVTFTMPSNAVTLTAHTATNALDRQALYWYGCPAASAPSDSDHDGFTFAEEVDLGTNPLFADAYPPGGIEYADSALLLYNPFCIQPYIVRSEPEGALFATSTNWVRAGTTVTTTSFSPTDSAFAYWTSNGAQQRDRWGRARDALSFAMPSNEVEMVAHTESDYGTRMQLYWYGGSAYMPNSDSDSDGFTFAEELDLGTNPLFFDEYAPGGIEYADSELLEANLQPFEQLTRGLVGGEAVEIFRSNWERNEGAMTFGTNAAVAVVDANGDGLEDLLIAGIGAGGAAQTTLLLNGGKTGSPDFAVGTTPWPALTAAVTAGSTLAGGLGPNGHNGVYISGAPIRFFDFTTGTFTDTALSGIPAWHDGVLYALDPATGTIRTADGALTLDTPVIRGVSLAVADADHDGLPDILVTDADGRVWFYKGNGEEGTWNGEQETLQPFNSSTFQLRHKVWGGSFGGFAEGLRIAAIDWNADGNLDAVGATADGHLVLLRDPRVGVPANLRLAAGLTSVVLEWDPSTQSRVRGYRVYRAEERTGDFAQLTTPWTPLPSYRDYPETLRDWWYRVTSVGRFYTSGNSAPTFIESAPTEAQVAHLGGIELFVRDANGITGQEVEIIVAINNSLGVAAKDLSFTLEYDTALLEARRVLPSGLTEAVQFSQNAANGRWTVSCSSGTVDIGAGTLFTLVFYVKPQHVADETMLTITSATAKSVGGQTATIPLPVRGTLSIFDTDPPIKPKVVAETCVREVMERETVALPIVLGTDRTLDRATVRIEGSWDTSRLEFVRIDAETGYSGNGSFGELAPPAWRITGATGVVPTGTNILATLVFRALDVEADSRTVLPVTNVAAVSTAGVAVSSPPPDPFVVRILNNPAFDPVHAAFLPGTASAKIGTEASLPVAVTVDAPLDGAAWSISGTYDTALLSVLGAVPLAPGCTVSCTTAGGAFTVRGTGGTLAASADAQPLFALRVKPSVQYTTRTTAVAFSGPAAKATDGRDFLATVGAGGGVAIRFASDTDGPVVSLDAWADEVVERETVSVPVRLSTTEALDRSRFAMSGTFDPTRLEIVRIDAANGFTGSFGAGGTWSLTGQSGVVPEGAVAPAALVFRAKDVAADAMTLVHVTGGTAVSTEGLSGTMPTASWSILVKNNSAYDPAHAVFLPGSSATKVGVATTLPVAVNLDAPLAGAQWSVQGTFDTTLLNVTGATAANGMSVTFTKSGGTFTVRGTGGTLAASPDSQALFTLAVTPVVQYATRLAKVTLRNPSAKTPDGRTFAASVAAGGDIALRFSDSDEPPIVSFQSEKRSVVERERVTVPVKIVTTDTLDLPTLSIQGTWQTERLTFVEARIGDVAVVASAANGVWSIAGTSGLLPCGEAILANLVFDAMDVERDTTTQLDVISASVRSAEGLAGTIQQAQPFFVTIRNNPAFDPVHAAFLPGTASAKIGTEASLPVAVTVDAPLDGAAWSISGTYDTALLSVLGAVPLAPGCTVSCTTAGGAFTVRGIGGTLAASADAQPLFALRVKPSVQYTTRTTAVAFSGPAAKATDGRDFLATVGAGGGVAIRFASDADGPVVSLDAWAGEVVERETISIPVKLSTTEALDRGQFAIEGTWDTNRLELVRMDGMQNAECRMQNESGAWRIEGTDGVIPAGTIEAGTLVFRAKDVAADTTTLVNVTGGTAVSTEGIAGTVPAASYSIMERNNVLFDPAHAVFMPDSSATRVGTATTLPVSVLIDAPLDGSLWSVSGTFDTTLLDVTGATAATGLSVTFAKSGGTFTVSGTGGALAASTAAQPLFTLNVSAKTQYAKRLANIALNNPSAHTTDGRTFEASVTAGGDIALRLSSTDDPPIVTISSEERTVTERERVSVPVKITANDAIDLSTMSIAGTWDTGRLTFVEARAGDVACAVSATGGRWSISGSAGILPDSATLANLVFEALDVERDADTFVSVTNAAVRSAESLDATFAPQKPQFRVHILNNPAFDPVHATFLPGTASAKIGTEAALPVSVQIDATLDGAAWSVSGTYDAALLDILGATAAPGTTNQCVAANGAFTVSGTGGTLAAGGAAQPLFALRVGPKVQYTTRTTSVAFANAAATAADGRVFETAIGTGGNVSIRFASATDGPVVTFDAFAGEVAERETISVPVRLSTTEALDRGQFAIKGTWDTNRLELVRIESADGYECSAARPEAAPPMWQITGQSGVVPSGTFTVGTLVFRAKDVAADTTTLVNVTGGMAVSTEGIAGTVPAASYLIMVRNNILFDPAHAVFMPGSSATRVGTATTLPVSVLVDAPLDGATWSVSGTFDTTLLDVTGATAATGLFVTFAKSGGTFTVTGTGGTLAASTAAQPLFTLNVSAKSQYAKRVANIALRSPSAQTTDSRTFEASVAAGGDIALRFTDSNDPPIVSFRSGALEVVERERVEVPIVLITTDTIDLSTLRVTGSYDADKLTLAGVNGGVGAVTTPNGDGTWTFTGQTGFLVANTATTLAMLVFEARDVEENTTTFVGVESAAVDSADGIAAIVRKASPIVVTIRNNPAFDPVHATFLPGTASAKIGTEASLPVAVQIDATLDGSRWSVSGAYDAALLDVQGAEASATGMTLDCTAGDGAFTVSGTGGALAAKTAAQPLFAIRVRPKEQYTTRTTAVSFTNSTATATDGRVFETTIGSGGGVAIHFSDTDEPPVISFPATAAEGYERREIAVPVRLETTQALDFGQFAIEGTWDTNRLELVRIEPMHNAQCIMHNENGTWGITGTDGVIPAGTVSLGTLVFRAKDVLADLQTQVSVTGGTAVSTEGIAAAGIPSTAFVVTVKNDPAFDPIHATFAIGSGTAEIGAIATVKVSATFDQPMAGATLAMEVSFNSSLMAVDAVAPHVNGFTLGWSVSGGVLTVTGSGGTIPVSSAKLDLLTISFRLAKQQQTHSADVSFASVGANSTDGRTYIVDAATGGSVAITWTDKPRYFKGDVNGDGVLNGDDIRYMQQMIANKKKPSKDEQKAWPLPQGSSVWTATSYQQLKAYFKQLGISNR